MDDGSTAPYNYVGQQGLHKYTFSGVGANDVWRDFIDTDSMTNHTIHTAFDFWEDGAFHTNTFDIFEGFFKPPTSANYRFLMSCDDYCNFKISTTDPLDHTTADEILVRGSWTTYRNTDLADKSDSSSDKGVIFSDWITLDVDTYYYVESYLGQGSGAVNIDIGMEIDIATITGDTPAGDHPKLEKQVQKMSIAQPDFLEDTLEIKVTLADDLALGDYYYILNYLDEDSLEFV